MNNKIVIASVALLILAAIFVSASLTFTVSVSNDLTRNLTSANVTVTNTGDSDILVSLSVNDLTDSSGNKIHFTVGSSQEILNGTGLVYGVKYDSFPSDFELGKFSVPITITAFNGTNTNNITQNINVVSEWCNLGDKGNLKITSIDDTSSDTRWEWHPLDEVDIDVDIKNNNKDSMDVRVEADLYDTQNNDFIGLDGDGNSVEDTITIDNGDTQSATLHLIVPTKAQNSGSRYILYIKAFDDDGEDNQCIEQTKNIDLVRENTRDVGIFDISVPDLIQCSGTGEISFKVANIGKTNEPQVRVDIRNSELGISSSEIIKNLNKDSNAKTLDFLVLVPKTAAEKTYPVSIDLYYNYNKNDDAYGITRKSISTANIVVLGNCVPVVQQDVLLSSSLETAAQAGKEMTVKFTLKNTGNTQTTYNLQVTGSDAWASNLRLSSPSVSLASGTSQDVLIYLTPNKGISGDKDFTVAASFGNQTKQQKIVISGIQKGFSFSLGNNGYLWLIIGINVILIIVIIIVAVSMGRKS